MFKKIVILVSLLLTPAIALTQGNIIHGPFNIDKNSRVYIKTENDINHPVGLYLERNNKSYKIDSYETNGNVPNIDTVFFIKLNQVKNIVILASWHQKHRAEKINVDMYKIYGYSYKNHRLIPNKSITNDPKLQGQNGDFNGEYLHFKYKNAASIKEYLKDKFT